MGQLFDNIRAAAHEDRVYFSDHADEMLRDRRIIGWQVVAGLAESRLLVERPDARPNPSVEVEQILSDGTPIKVVWVWLARTNAAKVVTVHFFDR